MKTTKKRTRSIKPTLTNTKKRKAYKGKKRTTRKSMNKKYTSEGGENTPKKTLRRSSVYGFGFSPAMPNNDNGENEFGFGNVEKNNDLTKSGDTKRLSSKSSKGKSPLKVLGLNNNTVRRNSINNEESHTDSLIDDNSVLLSETTSEEDKEEYLYNRVKNTSDAYDSPFNLLKDRPTWTKVLIPEEKDILDKLYNFVMLDIYGNVYKMIQSLERLNTSKPKQITQEQYETHTKAIKNLIYQQYKKQNELLLNKKNNELTFKKYGETFLNNINLMIKDLPRESFGMQETPYVYLTMNDSSIDNRDISCKKNTKQEDCDKESPLCSFDTKTRECNGIVTKKYTFKQKPQQQTIVKKSLAQRLYTTIRGNPTTINFTIENTDKINEEMETIFNFENYRGSVKDEVTGVSYNGIYGLGSFLDYIKNKSPNPTKVTRDEVIQYAADYNADPENKKYPIKLNIPPE